MTKGDIYSTQLVKQRLIITAIAVARPEQIGLHVIIHGQLGVPPAFGTGNQLISLPLSIITRF